VVYGLQVPHPLPTSNFQPPIPSPEEVAEIVASAWLPAPQADLVQDRQAQQAAVRQLQHYVVHHGESLSRVAQAETGFSFGLERYVLVGKIDLLRHTGGGYELIDFKAGRSAPAALEQVDAQLDLYALGAEASLRLPIVRQSAHFLEDDEVYTREWSPERATSGREWLEALLDQITRRQFPPRLAYCPRCNEFRAICPYTEDER